MRFTLAATLFATTLGIAVPSAFADPGLRFGAPGLAQPSSVRPTNYESYRSYYAQDEAASPSDLPAQPVPPTAAPAPAAAPHAVAHDSYAAPGYHASCGCSGVSTCRSCCDLGAPWTLFHQDPCGLKMGGWVAAGIYSNAHGSPSNGPLGFREQADEFALNQLWFFAEREANGAAGWDWGYRVDYVFGIDGPDTQAYGGTGFDTGWDTGGNYGSALPQLYGEVAYGDLKVKLGHFFTIMGYETVPTVNNFFTSHSYAHYYGEPFTHTGVLAEYAYNRDVTFYGGYTFGWDTGFEDGGNGAMFLGGVGLQLTENIAATYTQSVGNLNNVLGAGDVFLHSLVLDFTLTERLNYVFQHDYGVNYETAGPDTHWYGINQYLFYTLNDCWSIGSRFEWFDDQDGTRITSPAGVPFGAGDYYALTAGLNWRPHANLVVRPELRYDFTDGVDAFDGGTEDDQLSGGFDVIFTY